MIMKAKEKKIDNSYEDLESLSTNSLSSTSDENGFTDKSFNTSMNLPTLLNLNQHNTLETSLNDSNFNLFLLNNNFIDNDKIIEDKIFPTHFSEIIRDNIDSLPIQATVQENAISFENNIPLIMKKNSSPSTLILGDLVTENSSNAVDNKLILIQNDKVCLNDDLSFNGRIDSCSTNNTKCDNNSDKECSPEIIPNFIIIPSSVENSLITHDTSCMMYTNEKSPDLFDDDCDDDNGKNRKTIEEYEDGIDTSLTSLNSYDCESNKKFISPTIEKFIKDEEILLKRLQMSLTGVLPPPSITISQLNISKMVQLYKQNSEKYKIASSTKQTDTSSEESTVYTSLLAPTHTIDETIHMQWPALQEIKNHGIHLNRSKFSERFENLSLKYVERYIGAETSTSFTVIQSPTSAKKRTMRMKMLAKSPGNRLSHLARRRAIFSSESLAGQSSKSTLNSSIDNKRQILLDPRKITKHSRKTLTPKRRTPSRKYTPSRRKTPSSRHKTGTSKNLFGSNSNITVAEVSRETSKRALFQSPPKSKPINIPQITPEIANRAQKSKRVLFTPEKLIRSTSMNCFNNLDDKNLDKFNANSVKYRFNSMNCLNELKENTQNNQLSYKRKRSEFENEIAGVEKLTPNSMKFVKSQSFSVNTENKNPDIIGSLTGRHLLYRSTSEFIPSSSGLQSVSSQLSEHHRKKLLWAVSHALQLKQISVKHSNFKQYASVLARVTKKLYLQYEEGKLGSTSEKMMKLTNRLVFYVIQGKSVDEIYELESQNLENAKNKLERNNSFQIIEKSL